MALKFIAMTTFEDKPLVLREDGAVWQLASRGAGWVELPALPGSPRQEITQPADHQRYHALENSRRRVG